MQKLTAGIARLWNAGCLGKLTIGFVGLLVLGCCAAAIGGRQPAQQVAAPIAVPTALTTPIPATVAPLPTSAPAPTNTPAPTSSPILTEAPTDAPTATAEPQPTNEPACFKPWMWTF